MNDKLKSINELIEFLNPNEDLNEVGLADKVDQVSKRIEAIRKRIEDKKYDARKKFDNTGIGKVVKGIGDAGGNRLADMAKQGATAGLQSVIDTAGGEPADVLLSAIGLPAGTGAKIANLINKGIERLGKGATEEQKKKEAERILNVKRRNDGKIHWVVYTLTVKDKLPTTLIWTSPHALTQQDAASMFKKFFDKQIAEKTKLYGASYVVDKVSDTEIKNVVYPKYKIQIEWTDKDGTKWTKFLEPIRVKDQATAEKYADILWKREVARNPNRFFRASYKVIDVVEV